MVALEPDPNAPLGNVFPYLLLSLATKAAVLILGLGLLSCLASC